VHEDKGRMGRVVWYMISQLGNRFLINSCRLIVLNNNICRRIPTAVPFSHI
jgi:hypothetical protein